MNSALMLDPRIALGVVLLLSGWLAVDWTLKLFGMCLGALAGLLILDLFHLAMPEFQPQTWLVLIAGIGGGALGWFVLQKLFKLLLFVCGFLASMVFHIRLDELYGLSERISGSFWGDFPQTPFFTLVVGLVGGLLLMMLEKYLLIVLTAIAGAVLIAEGNTLEQKWLIVAFVGMGIQYLLYRSFRGKKRLTQWRAES